MKTVEDLKSVMKTEWISANLDSVLQFYVNAFKIPEGMELWNWEAFVDTSRRKVAFQLFIQPKST